MATKRGDADREARLAEALRANLRRRKAQARAQAHDRDDARPEDGVEEDAPPPTPGRR